MIGNFDLQTAVLIFIAIVACVTVHEFGHAIVADRLGDDTPRRHGRITLNPIVLMKAHPFGALFLPLLGAINGFMFGFAATPVNVAGVRRDITLRKAQILITGAGVTFNVIFGVISAVLHVLVMWLFVQTGADWLEPLRLLTIYLVITNVVLAVFNLIPVAPLDGHHLFEVIAGDRFPEAVAFTRQYGFVLLILLFVYGHHILNPFIRLALAALRGLTGLVV